MCCRRPPAAIPNGEAIMRTKYLLISAALMGAAAANAAAAYDPPSRVARLAYLHGAVSFAPAGIDDWALASLNRPVVTGDRIWTEPGARDELQLGNAAVRMDGATLVNVLNLDDQAMQVQLTQGTLNIRVRPGRSSGVIEVDTPNLALTIQRPGHYRVSVDPAGRTTLLRVADGQAQVYGPANSYLVGPNQAYRFAGTNLRDMQFADARQRDAFDSWSDDRDRRAERSVATRYVSPALIGYEDLDDYGNWRTVDGYGPVWTPRRVARDWAPYRDGHWAWVAPWGWTWVDDAPWGFAVSHYGRWANFGGSWGWVPGPAAAQPVYAPALVVFVDAVASPRRDYGPAVAWFPLAPREAYRPPYQVSQRYLTNINVSNPVNPAQAAGPGFNYQNRRINGATTAVPANVFARAQPVRRSALALPPDTLARATLAPAAPVQAQRESLASRYAGGHRPAQAALARQVMVHTKPANVPVAAPAAHGPRMANVAPPQPMPAPVMAPGERDPRLAAQPIPAPREAIGHQDHRRETGPGREAPPVPQVLPSQAATARGHGEHWRGTQAAPLPVPPTIAAPAPANLPPQMTAAPRQEQQRGHGPHGAAVHNVAAMPQPMPAPAAPVPASVAPPPVAAQVPPQFEHGHGRHQRPQPAPRVELAPSQPVQMPAPQPPMARHEPHQERPQPQPAPQPPMPRPEPRQERQQPQPAVQPQAAAPHPEPHPAPPRPEPAHHQPAPQPPVAQAAPQPAPEQHDKGGEHHGNGHKDKEGKGK
jgi:hypothetical protein